MFVSSGGGGGELVGSSVGVAEGSILGFWVLVGVEVSDEGRLLFACTVDVGSGTENDVAVSVAVNSVVGVNVDI